MKIWHYHPETGDLLGASIADPDPLDAGAFLVPACATASEPPRVTSSKRVRWDRSAGAWKTVPKKEPKG